MRARNHPLLVESSVIGEITTTTRRRRRHLTSKKFWWDTRMLLRSRSHCLWAVLRWRESWMLSRPARCVMMTVVMHCNLLELDDLCGHSTTLQPTAVSPPTKLLPLWIDSALLKSSWARVTVAF